MSLFHGLARRATASLLSSGRHTLRQRIHGGPLRPNETALPNSVSEQFYLKAGSRAFVSAANSSDRPFKILGVQQIAVGSTDKEKLRALWVDKLGLTMESNYRSEKENVDEDILRIGEGPTAVEVDIMQPIDPEKAPKVHNPPLNHFGLWVDDLPKAYEWLQQQGVRFAPGGIRKGGGGHDVAFIHPKGNDEYPLSGQGVLIELVQAPEEVRQLR
eukprot:gb/GECG01002106.1/.p1 GENE.gb/GECG01002106.1/~~gb/GECG01002106.1/.p1  ORF type:complete len:215 (+),score=33.97 gb/GECG01002106.1/:1-645(+)